jgi:hypothetical protein
VHCVAPGGGISPDGSRWIGCRAGFFLPVRVLSRLFRRLFLEALQNAYDTGSLQFFSTLEALCDKTAFAAHLAATRQTEWVVYAKAPFGGPAQVLRYLGRYTHRVAISNERILGMDEDSVSFRVRDPAHGNRRRTLRLPAQIFIDRFLLHILPKGLMRSSG